MMTTTPFSFSPSGVCSRRIDFDLDAQGKIRRLRFTGGCDGNLKALGILLEGSPAAATADKLRGNMCEDKGTSCANELAKALDTALVRLKHAPRTVIV